MPEAPSYYYNPDRPPIDRRRSNGAPSRSRIFNVSKIWEHHEEIVRRLVLGQKNTEIADAMNLSPQTISNVRNSPIIQERLSVMKGARDAETVDIAREIRQFAPIALDLLKRIIKGEREGELASPALKVSVAKDVLDRAGFAPVRNISMQSVHAHLTREDIEAIKQRAFQTNAPLIEMEQ